MNKFNQSITLLFLIFMPLKIWAEESDVVNDWLITFDDTACWASALIAEDPINDEYDPNKDFQLTVSFHNRVPLPQFTITSVTQGKTVTSASVKFNELILDFVVIISPFCKGKNFFFDLIFKITSIQFTNSNNLIALPLPILKISFNFDFDF